jgi:DnaJ domain
MSIESGPNPDQAAFRAEGEAPKQQGSQQETESVIPETPALSVEQQAQILGVDTFATEEEIEDAYKRLMIENHPDKTGGIETKKFKEIRDVYASMKLIAEKRRKTETVPQESPSNGNNPIRDTSREFTVPTGHRLKIRTQNGQEFLVNESLNIITAMGFDELSRSGNIIIGKKQGDEYMVDSNCRVYGPYQKIHQNGNNVYGRRFGLDMIIAKLG